MGGGQSGVGGGGGLEVGWGWGWRPGGLRWCSYRFIGEVSGSLR